MKIPVNAPLIPRNAKKYINDCLNSGWISSAGPYVNEFEREFAKYCGIKYAVTTTSGTTALHLALAALGIDKGDEVILPTFTMIAPVFAVLYVGARPVFVDCEEDTWNMDVSQIEKKITKKTKAILAVHIYGHPVDIDPLKKLANKYGLYLVEDAAEALGAEYKGKKVGTLGDVACFSFYANKLITTGEGGMVTTDNKNLFRKLVSLKDMAHSPKKRFLHLDVGFTFRMSNLQAALGLAQLEDVKKNLLRQRKNAELYTNYLSKVSGLTLPNELDYAKHSRWVYGILVTNRFGRSKDQLRKILLKKGIETRDFFIPMHRQPILKKLGLINSRDRFPIADRVYRQGFYLPSGMALKESEIRYITKAIKLAQRSKL